MPLNLLPGTTAVEIIDAQITRGRIRSVLFDFDGTISLIRQGWREIMVPMMVEILTDLETDETQEELTAVVGEFVDRLTGKQTIYQMIQLCEEVQKRGGTPEDPLEYKHQYHDRLMGHIEGRIDGLKSGAMPPHEAMVAGSIDLLSNLRDRGLMLYLASGTDAKYVHEEAALLGVTEFFGEHIYGALDDYEKSSKGLVIQDILKTHSLKGEELLGFGDGYVEIENVVDIGGLAVGVASDEARGEGVDGWKRERLIKAGAQVIIPEYREQKALVSYLCD